MSCNPNRLVALSPALVMKWIAPSLGCELVGDALVNERWRQRQRYLPVGVELGSTLEIGKPFVFRHRLPAPLKLGRTETFNNLHKVLAPS